MTQENSEFSASRVFWKHFCFNRGHCKSLVSSVKTLQWCGICTSSRCPVFEKWSFKAQHQASRMATSDNHFFKVEFGQAAGYMLSWHQDKLHDDEDISKCIISSTNIMWAGKELYHDNSVISTSVYWATDLGLPWRWSKSCQVPVTPANDIHKHLHSSSEPTKHVSIYLSSLFLHSPFPICH